MTVSRLATFASKASFTPWTRRRSFIDPKLPFFSRSFTIAAARLESIPGTVAISAAPAVFTSTGNAKFSARYNASGSISF